KYVGRGRFAEKGGGQQVASAIESCSDNEKIKVLYGNYGFWSWLRYWFIDSADFITLMLIDKGYYDYDYQEPKIKQKLTAEDKEIWSAEKLNAILGVNPQPKHLTPEEAQKIVMEEIKAQKKK
ncbi:MAG: hypothetical protein NC548_63545, partial [Lachnospiraceae bacterium]|nr:hypothetical protein [Lachnospiraceae bacterium]